MVAREELDLHDVFSADSEKVLTATKRPKIIDASIEESNSIVMISDTELNQNMSQSNGTQVMRVE